MQSSVSTSDTLLDFEEVELPQSLLEVRLATGVVVRTEKRAVRVRFSPLKKKFVDELIVLDLDDKFDMVLGMPWVARHYQVVDWAKRTIVRFRKSSEKNQKAHIQSYLRDSRSVKGDAVVSTVVDTQVEQEGLVIESSTLGASAPGADAIGPNINGRSAVRRRGKRGASALGADAASSAYGCKRPAPEMLACPRAAELCGEAVHNQVGLDCVRPRVNPAGDQKKDLSTAGPGQKNTRGTGFRTSSKQHKRAKLHTSRSGTETLHAMPAGQTQQLETTIETLSGLTRTDTGLQYRKMALESPPTLALELTSWKRSARDLHDGRIEQIGILPDVERMKCEAEELKQLVTEGADALSAKSKKERFDEQSWHSLKSSMPCAKVHPRASEIPVLGCLVRKNGVRPDPGKVRAINEWPTSSNVKEQRQFLGLATYLCNQTQDSTEAPISAVANQDRPFHVVCDASDFAIGCALMHHDHEGRDRVVYYQSRQLKPAERNYPVHEAANVDRAVVPDDHDLKLRITYEYHDAPTSGHPGREKTYLLLTSDFYWSRHGRGYPVSPKPNEHTDTSNISAVSTRARTARSPVNESTLSTPGIDTLNINKQHTQAAPVVNKDVELNTEFSSKAMDFVHRRQAVIRFVQDAIAASVDRQKLNADNNGRGNTNEFKVGS
ncbi:unnamed protein product [Phytophthora fragariaefolia]|uniref:Unnamed protein product n=1 Tax=Phytophthora fragariaefolia TaxID=1490495 RepID=A0A9W6XX72_9STRA|nr:unnamed protein product [Phytophthora fragariaefolia]